MARLYFLLNIEQALDFPIVNFLILYITMSDTRRNIFDFNHIDTTLSKGTVEMLKHLYAYYHKKQYGYEKLYRSYQRKNLICNISAGKLIVSAAVAGGITLNPVVIATLTGVGLIVKAVATFKKYDKKVEKANFARIDYKKILDEIRFYLRGEPFNEKAFLERLKMIDDFISDHCMEIPSRLNVKYSKLFAPW